MYFWIMVLPTVTFQALMFTLIGCGLFVEVSEHSGAMHTLIELFLFVYNALTVLINAVFVVVTIWTWKTVHDNINVRGELIGQTVVLGMTYLIAGVIHLCDVLWDDGNVTLSDDGEEQYDEAFNIGYFINFIVGCLCSIIIGTQYVRFTDKKKEKQTSTIESARRQHKDSPRTIIAGEMAKDRTKIDFRSVIPMSSGLDAFMNYLAKENEQNYLIVKWLTLYQCIQLAICLHYFHQLAMELTQYMEKLCLHFDLTGSHPDLLESVRQELLHFPDTVPNSTLIHSPIPSLRTTFIHIFDKYIGDQATWKVRLQSDTQEQLLKYYRRFDDQKKHTIYPHRTHHVASISDVDSLHGISPSLRQAPSEVRNKTMLKSLVDAVIFLKQELTKHLDVSFQSFRETAVKCTCLDHIILPYPILCAICY